MRKPDGCRQILWGFFKKMVVADNCATAVNLIWGTIPTSPAFTLLMGGFLFTLQIYGDFPVTRTSLSVRRALFGINLMRNFSFPLFLTRHCRVLAPLAYIADHMVSRLHLHTSRRQPMRTLEGHEEYADYLSRQRFVARGQTGHSLCGAFIMRYCSFH